MSALRPHARLALRSHPSSSATLSRALAICTTTTTTTTPASTPTVAMASTSTSVVPARFRYFSATPRRAGGGGMQYDPPSGWLWGVRPGEKYQNEGWEGPFFYGFWGSMVVFVVAYAWKPDTS